MSLTNFKPRRLDYIIKIVFADEGQVLETKAMWRMLVGKTQTVAIEIFAVSAAYIVLFTLTFSVIMPAQSVLFAFLPMNISLLFLPHGVRILAIYLYGWRAVLYLLPAHLATWAYLYFYLGSEQSISSGGVSILASLMAMLIVFQKVQGVTSVAKKDDWKRILIAGAVASLLNGLGHATLYGDVSSLKVDWIIITLGFMIGDVSGLFFLMVIMIYVFRLIDRKTAS